MSLEEKAKKMETAGEWGGQVDVQVLSILLDRRIWVHRAGQDTLPHGDESETARRTDCLQLSYHEHQYDLGEHYNSIVSGGWPSKVFLPSSASTSPWDRGRSRQQQAAEQFTLVGKPKKGKRNGGESAARAIMQAKRR